MKRSPWQEIALRLEIHRNKSRCLRGGVCQAPRRSGVAYPISREIAVATYFGKYTGTGPGLVISSDAMFEKFRMRNCISTRRDQATIKFNNPPRMRATVAAI